MKHKEVRKPVNRLKDNTAIVDRLPLVADDDPVLLRKEQEALKSFNETPWPPQILQRIIKED